ncbi:polyketide synthase dehydratase domain-containing protein [Streptomyces sp. NRRL B-1347]|uniref:polyketide synthase dehydratase domain-containing protein n=1 Tax=Streptomyces sp. NRRL B-1347 TaxID=1476877 RepID=UPI0018FE2C46
MEVYSQREDAGDEADAWTRHATGLLSAAARPDGSSGGSSGGGGSSVDFTAWPPRGAQPVEVGDFYEALAERGYGYGPAFSGRAVGRGGGRGRWPGGHDGLAGVPAGVGGPVGGGDGRSLAVPSGVGRGVARAGAVPVVGTGHHPRRRGAPARQRAGGGRHGSPRRRRGRRGTDPDVPGAGGPPGVAGRGRPRGVAAGGGDAGCGRRRW